MMPLIKLQSTDGHVFQVPSQVYKHFNRINSIIQNPFYSQTFEDNILVPNVNASSLYKVLKWTVYHMDDDFLGDNGGCMLSMCEWDRELLQVEKNVLVEMVLAADFLGIQGLLDVTMLKFNDFIKYDCPPDVEDSSSLDDDFIAEQLEKEYLGLCTEFERSYEIEE